MAIQVLSDIHLDAPKAYDIFEITPKAAYLAFLGDIGNVVSHQDGYLAFLRDQLRPYHASWPSAVGTLRAFEQDVRRDDSLGAFMLLARNSFAIPDSNLAVLGCSLFSRVPNEGEEAASFGIEDFYHIEGWDVPAYNAAHERDLAWLNGQVAALEGREAEAVVLTHSSPTRAAPAVNPKHAQSLIRADFSMGLSDQVCFKSSDVKVWPFGHTHCNCDVLVEREGGAGPLRFVTN
ncbi:hypothetical protein BS50DRAFT_607111 [Corynespora cassiicola Philippines]|uniref:Calcineurin-like phosphoesterase domain-containing protein n=1 Tax=Corynespora cassiicola Philippines TaxID=1448308 RepID=A0A2T2P752_CORCC|nr:hypothetical protein BS50DRAFT_607111 [Corynespora cassiicola Philippines]